MEISTIDDYFFNEENLTDISFDKEDCIYTYAISLESGEKDVSHIKVDMYAIVTCFVGRYKLSNDINMIERLKNEAFLFIILR